MLPRVESPVDAGFGARFFVTLKSEPVLTRLRRSSIFTFLVEVDVELQITPNMYIYTTHQDHIPN